ncbi:MAG TPA: HEAT repeat domain-containing protein [Polyangiaceae bacterium]|nr:HEAT repeat domain-containing protein [Polyangiaceae bacterium]
MSDDLRRALADPGYTPPRRAFGDMLRLLGHPELGARAEKALLSAGLPAASFAARSLLAGRAAEPALVRLIGRALRAHDDSELLDALLKGLQGRDLELRREAAVALGKSGRAAAEPMLLDCLDTADPKLLRSVIEALGKVGGERALEKLGSLSVPTQLTRVVERARVMLERSVGRRQLSEAPLLLDSPLPQTCRVMLWCRPGLAQFLAEEAAGLGACQHGAGEAQLDYSGVLRTLLELRLASGLAIAWPLPGGAAPEQVLEALLAPELAALLRSWTTGPLRFRLEWQGAGHRRADTWHVAQGLRERQAVLINDPMQAPWTIEVERAPTPRLLLKPLAAPELRFDYRARDVPAASHPTLAAALARVAGARDSDVVWDPFTGSGIELIERAKLGSFRELHGTDLDARALAAAQTNLERAQIAGAVLEQADARTHRIAGLTLVLTNPPMGRRVLRARGLSGVLCQVVRHVAGQLLPGGRMVWLSPFADATARAAGDAGLAVERLSAVDLGGFSAELQRFSR